VSFLNLDYAIELSGGIPFAVGGSGVGNDGAYNEGRNDKLKSMVAAGAEAGQGIINITRDIIAYDKKHHSPPLFTDPLDPQMRGSSVTINALRFALSVLKSINKKRRARGLEPHDLSIEDASIHTIKSNGLIQLSNFYASRFVGNPPEIRWLVANIFKLGAAYMLAGMGDIGKGFLTLYLAIQVAFFRGCIRTHAFGGTVMESGTAVIISCEDSAEVYHQRLAELDPNGLRFKYPEKLILISLPDAGGTRPFVVKGKSGLETTPFYEDFRRQLLEIPDLKAVFFDTMQGLFQCDFNSDPAAGQYCAGVQQELATTTGSCVISNHHMRKPNIEITSPALAREAIRGTTAIVDGLRGAYALWPVPDKESRRIAADLGLEWRSNLVVNGAIVKSNSAESRHVATYIRNSFGLLEDRTHDLRITDPEDLRDKLAVVLFTATASGNPFFKTGNNGVFKRRDELSLQLQGLSRQKLESMVGELESLGRIFSDPKFGITFPNGNIPGNPAVTMDNGNDTTC